MAIYEIPYIRTEDQTIIVEADNLSEALEIIAERDMDKIEIQVDSFSNEQDKESIIKKDGKQLRDFNGKVLSLNDIDLFFYHLY